MNTIEIYSKAADLAAQRFDANPAEVLAIRIEWDTNRQNVNTDCHAVIEDRVSLAESYCQRVRYEIELDAEEATCLARYVSKMAERTPHSTGQGLAKLSLLLREGVAATYTVRGIEVALMHYALTAAVDVGRPEPATKVATQMLMQITSAFETVLPNNAEVAE